MRPHDPRRRFYGKESRKIGRNAELPQFRETAEGGEKKHPSSTWLSEGEGEGRSRAVLNFKETGSPERPQLKGHLKAKPEKKARGRGRRGATAKEPFWP